ncbi:hypothetical protein LPJ53_004731 [Coemansia erecta]|uniref:SET domain-containing protein n=1 Tax=Coemansia erecta TaxID=147472 RepID=A0A9W8CNW3_9FUNG|nr:hypothetical protein LPJ53_004731 [Coemansia erecta]
MGQVSETTEEAGRVPPDPGPSRGRGGTRGRPRGRPPGPAHAPVRPSAPVRPRGRPPGPAPGLVRPLTPARPRGHPPGVVRALSLSPTASRGIGRGRGRGRGRGQEAARGHGSVRGRIATVIPMPVPVPVTVPEPLMRPPKNQPSQPVLDSRSVPLVVTAQKRNLPKKSRQQIAAETSGHTDGSGIYVVEAILNDADFGGVHLFELKWEGYSLAETSWVKKSDLDNCKEHYKTYMKNRPVNTADLRKFYILVSEAQSTQPIVISNTVDTVGCPDNFTYINENIYSENIPRPCTPLCPCTCTDNCKKDCECVEGQYYDSDGALIADRDVPLMECGPRCACSEDCVTRVIQKGSNVNLEIFRTQHKGWGVRSRQHIKKGTFIAEYVGEIITSEDADRRGCDDTAAGLTYLFDLDMNTPKGAISEFSIDAKTHGNISHFFNHSCDPNLEIRQAFVEHRDPRLHRLVFFTTRDIEPKEELVFDYDPSNDGVGKMTIRCFCGAKKCRKVIVF